MVTKTFVINEEEIIYSIKDYIKNVLNKKGLSFTIHSIDLIGGKDISAYAEITTDEKIEEILQKARKKLLSE